MRNARKTLSFLASIIALMALAVCANAAQTYYVSMVDDGGSDTNDGLTVTTPFATIQHALDMAGSGDNILVHKGTYYEHDLDFHGRDIILTGVPSILAMVSGQGVIIDAQGLGRCFVFHSGETRGAVVRGFGLGNQANLDLSSDTLAADVNGSFWDALGGSGSVSAGAAIRIVNSSPTIEFCAFFGIGSFSLGGSADVGGAIAVTGGSPRVANSAFLGNMAYVGGAIYSQNSNLDVVNCLFNLCVSVSGPAVVADGGTVRLVNNSLVAVFTTIDPTIAVTAPILSVDGASVHVTNTVIYNDAAQVFDPYYIPQQSLYAGFGGTLTASYSNVQGSGGSGVNWSQPGVTDGGGNIDVDLSSNNYIPSPGHPLFDAGNDAAYNAVAQDIAYDILGSPRFYNGGRIDIGAVEYRPNGNQAPIAQDDTVTAVKNTALAIPVLANDSDPENDPLTIESVSSAAHGQVTINSDGTITYKPTGNYLGTDFFTYTISDGKGGTSTATVNVNVALQTSVLVTNASCVGTGSVALYARLVQGTTAGKNNLLAGQPLLFLVNGVPVGTGITDAYGKAYVNYLPVAAGTFPLTVQYAGNAAYAPSAGTGTLTVTPSATEITVQPTGGTAGSSTTIRGRLARTTGNKGLAGAQVTVSVDGNVVGTVTTGTDGVFTIPYSIPAGATAGAHNITASFAGNALNSPSTGSATLTVTP